MDKKTLEPAFEQGPLDTWAAQCGGERTDDGHGPQIHFPRATAAPVLDVEAGFVCPLPDLGLITVDGAEASRFLQSQLTNEVEQHPPQALVLNGYCTAKGRLLANGWQWREEGAVNLLVSRPLAHPLVRRLSMFVMRAKARVRDRSAETVCFGLAGRPIESALAALSLSVPAAGTVQVGANGLVALAQTPVPWADRSLERVLLVAPAESLAMVWSTLLDHFPPQASARWRFTEILAGTPRITPPVSEHFVPQMVNLDLVGGVSFKKGCYPGQEVVARSHYLGKLKRRMYRAWLPDGPVPDPGTDIEAAESGQPCGEVVMAAADPGGGIALLIESQIEQVSSARLGDRALVLQPLPYALA